MGLEIRTVWLSLLLWTATAPAPASADVDKSLLCSTSYCEKEECNDPQPHCSIQNATHSGIWMLSPTFCNCCEDCLVFQLEGDECSEGSLGSPPSGTVCGPGLSCRKEPGDDHSLCYRMKSKCHDVQDDYDDRREEGTLGATEQRALCNDDGNFGPRVCVAGQTCFCQNVDGERIFGEIINEKDFPANMKCKCSRTAEMAHRHIGEKSISLRCGPDGSYDPMQCIGNRCFCVDSESGLLSSAMVVDLELQFLSQLPCFDKSIHHSNKTYLRECEKLKMEMRKEIAEAEEEGFTLLGSPLLQCQPDGRFPSVTVKEDRRVCIDANGKQIMDFGAALGSPGSENMDCKCARTYNLLLQSSASSSLPACCPNGNWKRVQCRRGLCYCVTSDGLQNQLEVDISEIDTLKCGELC